MTLIVRELENKDEAAWNEYVDHHLNGCFFHLSGWKRVIEKTSKHLCPYLLAERNNKIIGILPLTIRRGSVFGRAAISGFFGVLGHALVDDKDIECRLYDEAWKLCQKYSVPSLEIKFENTGVVLDETWHCVSDKFAVFRKPIARTSDERMKAIPRKQRAVVRKSLENGLTVETGPELLKQVYHLYAISVHRLGTPVFPFKLFTNLLDEFGERVDIVLVSDENQNNIAGLVSFYYKDCVLPYYAGSCRSARKLGAHDYMYFNLMERAYARGALYFDFGRSRIGTGPYFYKKNWGFEPLPLTYAYKLKPGTRTPDMSPLNPKFELMSTIWKKLPLSVANIVGPWIARDLG